MAARRRSSSSSSRSSGSGRRAPSRAASSGSNPVPVIIGAGVIIVVILVMVTMTGEDPKPNNTPANNKQVETPKEPPKETPPAKDDQAGLKDPDTPAPAMDNSALIAADKIYDKAKKLNADARIAQSKGEGDKFNKLINDAWDLLKEIEAPLEKYTLWLEEATMEDWKVPGSYRQLQLKLNKYDKLRGQIKRIKPNRR